MLSFHPERKDCCRLSFVGLVHADGNLFSKVENELSGMSTIQRTLIVDITKLIEISNAGKEILPHLFREIKGRGFCRANLVAKRCQVDLVQLFGEVLDREFGHDGTISLE